MTTNVTSLGLTSPVTFLNSTVLSFNGNLGFGGQESSLTVELVDDCDAGQGFPGMDPSLLVGSVQYFPRNSGGMLFSFGGIVTDWKINESSGGKTYSVTLNDPRRLLENVMIIVDTLSAGTSNPGPNTFNVYAYFEPRETLEAAACANFGASLSSSERGMPYWKVIQGLQQMGIGTYTPTGSLLSIDLSNIDYTILPQHYRVNGPAVSLLQIITDITEATGYDFYVYLGSNNTIKFQFINLKIQPPNLNTLSTLISGFGGVAIDRSYGRELRIEKQKTMILGEKKHYLMPVSTFKPFFGENAACLPVTAQPNTSGCGFQVLVNTAPLAASMRYAFSSSNLIVTELDIRSALGSFQLWKDRVQTASIPGSFNAAVRQFLASHNITNDPGAAFNAQEQALKVSTPNRYRYVADRVNNPGPSDAIVTTDRVNEDLQKIHNYVVTLGRTYYGKQYLARLNQSICYKTLDGVSVGENCITSELMYSSEPTNDGGWMENGTIIGLQDPYLGFFRQEDGRIGAFAVFNESGDVPPTSASA